MATTVRGRPRTLDKYVLDTEACDHQLGCAILQLHVHKSKHPVVNWSTILNKTERNYSRTEKECLSVVWAILLFRRSLGEQWVTAGTDHPSLGWILNLTEATGRLGRWRMRHAEYDFEIEHRMGAKHRPA